MSAPPRALVAALAVAIGLGCLVRRADAHQSSMTRSSVTVDGDQVHYRIVMEQLDASVLIGDDLDPAAITGDQAVALGTAVTGAITVADRDVPCPPGPATVEREGDKVAVSWTMTCPRPIAELALAYDLLFFDDPTHTAALHVEVPGREPANTLLDVDHARFVWPLRDTPSTAPAFVRAGLRQGATGGAAAGFLVALLLVVVVVRAGEGWRVPELPAAARAAAIVVIGFALADALTMIAGTLGWVVVPAAMIDAAIALSILWTAVDDVARPDGRGRLALAAGFGLVHGLGGAAALAPVVPSSGRAVPVVCLAAGVEVAHLTAAAMALPLLWLAARAAGPARYRRILLPIAAGLLVVAAALTAGCARWP